MSAGWQVVWMQDRTKWLLTAAGVAAAASAGYLLYRRNENRKNLLTPDDLNLRADLPGDRIWLQTVDGASLLVTRSGPPDGPTVVLAHCWTGSRRVWAPVARRLVRAGCNVIRWDQRGHGESSTGSDGNTIANLGRDLAMIVEQLDVRDAVLAGHSMGGMTALSFATQYPEIFDERIRALVLVDTAGYGLANPLSRLAPQAVRAAWLDRVATTPATARSLSRPTFGTWAAEDHLQLMAHDFANTAPRVREDFAAEFSRMNMRAAMQRIDKPTAIIVGSMDILTPARLSRAMHSDIKGSTLQVVAGQGHEGPLESPALVANTILSLAR